MQTKTSCTWCTEEMVTAVAPLHHLNFLGKSISDHIERPLISFEQGVQEVKWWPRDPIDVSSCASLRSGSSQEDSNSYCKRQNNRKQEWVQDREHLVNFPHVLTKILLYTEEGSVYSNPLSSYFSQFVIWTTAGCDLKQQWNSRGHPNFDLIATMKKKGLLAS